MSQGRSPTVRLLAGLVITLSAVALYSGYTVMQLRGLERLQGGIIDRNRADSLLLLRIQNNLNSIGLAMRDMLDGSEPYPLTAWQGQFRRIRTDLEDALAREAQSSPLNGRRRTAQVPERLAGPVLGCFGPHLRAGAERSGGRGPHFDPAIAAGPPGGNRHRRRTAAGAEQRKRAAGRGSHPRRLCAVWSGTFTCSWRPCWWCIVLTSLYLVQYNRRMFQEVAALSARRSELAQQLIAMQENTFRSISRDLHDDFGQILTAIGAMLQRASRRLPAGGLVGADLREVQEIAQSTLDKVRALSHALHPVMLDEIGFESALDQYLPGFQKQTGIEVQYERTGTAREIDSAVGDPSLSCDAGDAEQCREAFAIGARGGAASLSAGIRPAGSGRSRRGLPRRADLRDGPGVHARAGRIGTRPSGLGELQFGRSAGPSDGAFQSSGDSCLKTSISVLLVDDHSLVRRGFRRMLEDDPDITVVGEAERRP